MKKQRTNKVMAGVLLAISASAAIAGDWYAGMALGTAHLKDDASGNGMDISRDSTSAGFKLFAGYRINPYLAAEAGYSHLGKETFHWQSGSQKSGAGDIKAQSFSAALVGNLVLTREFGLFARLGVAQVQGKYQESWSQPGYAETISRKKSKAVAHYGAGVIYALDRDVALRAEYEGHSKIKDNDIGVRSQLVSLGLIYRF